MKQLAAQNRFRNSGSRRYTTPRFSAAMRVGVNMTPLRGFRASAFIFLVCALAASTAWALPAAAQDVPTANPLPADVDQGKQTFEQRCSTCHGLDGGGAMGPNIQGIPMRLGAAAVADVIKNGMRGGIPAFAG